MSNEVLHGNAVKINKHRQGLDAVVKGFKAPTSPLTEIRASFVATQN